MALAVIAAALVIVVGSIAISFAAGNIPGSAEDPVVSKSYVDAQLEALKAELSEKFAAPDAPGGAWDVVLVKAGKSVIGGQGTEIILRSGKATAIDNGSDGVSDLTAANDLMKGEAIADNHLLLVPRADGRGIHCTTDCWLMILGSYEVK